MSRPLPDLIAELLNVDEEANAAKDAKLAWQAAMLERIKPLIKLLKSKEAREILADIERGPNE